MGFLHLKIVIIVIVIKSIAHVGSKQPFHVFHISLHRRFSASFAKLRENIQAAETVSFTLRTHPSSEITKLVINNWT